MNKVKNKAMNRTKNTVQKAGYDIYRLGADPRCHVSTNSFETRLNNNVMVIGGSGAGKTTGVTLPMLLHCEHSNPIAVFTKRPMMMKVARYLKKKRNMDVQILDISCPRNSTTGYDPLRQCRTRAEVKDLCRSVIYENPAEGSKSKDPYWDDSACGLLECFVEYALRDWNHNGTMPEVLELLDKFRHVPFDSQNGEAYDKTLQGTITRRLPEITHNTAVLGAWNTFVNLARNTASCIVSSLRTPVDMVFTSEIREFMKKEEQFDIESLLQKNTALFICMSPVSTAHQRFATLIYSQLFKNLYELAEKQPEGRLPYHVQLICDDFGTSPIQNFEAMISIMREKNISTTILLQSLSQLCSTYGNAAATTICNNCDRTVYLGSNDLHSAQEIAQRADLPAPDVLDMPIGSELYFQRGQKPILGKSYDVFADEAYAEMMRIAAKAEREEAKERQMTVEAAIKLQEEMLGKLDDICDLKFEDE